MNKTNSPFILFITGISGSGKSMLFNELKKSKAIGSDIVLHDIDENGVPKAGRKHWRQYRVEELFFEGVENVRKGKSTIICGIAYPFEVIDSDFYSPKVNLHFLFLETSYRNFLERTITRFSLPEVGEKIRSF